MALRWFAGSLGGIQRVRLSRPGVAANNINAKPRNIMFDTAWYNSLTIHARGIVGAGTTTFDFPALDYIPFVYVASCDSSGASQYWGDLFELPNVKVTNSRVTLPGSRSKPALIYVFRSVAFETRRGTGWVASGTKKPRVLMGQAGANLGSDQGLFISRPNYDVTKCGEGNIIYSSTKNQANIFHLSVPLVPVSLYNEGQYFAQTNIRAWPGFQPFYMMHMVPQDTKWLIIPSSRKINSGGSNITGHQGIAGTIILSNNNGNLRLTILLQNLGGSPPAMQIIIAIFDTPVKG